MSRLRGGELLALGGAVLLLVALFLPWFGAQLPLGTTDYSIGRPGAMPLDEPLPEEPGATLYAYVDAGAVTHSGWNSLGWLVLAVAAAAIATAAWLVIANVARRRVSQIVAANVVGAVIGAVALVVLSLRALVFQPGPNDLVDLRYGAWLGLAGALALTIGAWWALADERTGARESAYEPPPARPAPPERAS